MKIRKIVTTTLLCLLIISCGGSGKNKKREPSRRSKKNIEVVEKKKTTANDKESEEVANEETGRNNGNYRKPSQRKKGESKLRRKTKGRSVVPAEEDPAKASTSRIEKRVQLEINIWKANEKGDQTLAEKLRKEANELVKKMTQDELDEAYKKIKDIKKRM